MTRALVQGLLRAHRRSVVLAVWLALAAAAEVGLRPLLARWVVEAAVVRREPGAALVAAVVWTAVMATGVGLAYAASTAVSGLVERLLAELRVAVVTHHLGRPDGQEHGLGLAVGDTTTAAEQLGGVLPAAAAGALEAAAGLVALALVDTRVVAAVLTVVVAGWVPLTWWYRLRATAATTDFLTRYDRMSAAYGEAAAGAPTAWRFGRPDLARRFDAHDEAYERSNQRVSSLAARYTPAMTLLRGLAFAAAVAAAVWVVPARDRPGVLAAAAVAVPTLVSSAEIVSGVVDSLTIGLAALARLARSGVTVHPDAVTSFPESVAGQGFAPSGPVPATAGGPGGATVAVRGLTLRRPGFTLGPLTLDLHPGTTAVVGATGAGKTTLARLVAGLDRPDDGRVTLDGRPPELLAATGELVTLQQTPHLFPGTVEDNLRLVAPGPGATGAITDLIARAGLDRWLARLPTGLATPAERLTEGDRHIVAVLQALLRDPRVVVLDEPTASLDPMSGGLIEDAARRAFHGRTVVVVTHNLRTAQQADRVLLMVDGAVEGDGRNEQLVESSTTYRQLFALDDKARA